MSTPIVQRIDVNTTSLFPTHFLRGVELVRGANSEYEVPSENWPLPTSYKLGEPKRGDYYAEVWKDGMDWQHTYWLIETFTYDDPKCFPLIIFQDHADHFEDLPSLIEASLSYRKKLLKGESTSPMDLGSFHDEIWHYMNLKDDMGYHGTYRDHNMELCSMRNLFRMTFQHASQKRVEFYMNASCVPKYVLYLMNKKITKILGAN